MMEETVAMIEKRKAIYSFFFTFSFPAKKMSKPSQQKVCSRVDRIS